MSPSKDKNKKAKGGFSRWLAGLLAAVVLLLGAGYMGWLPGTGSGAHPQVVGGETRPILPPHLFGLHAGLAYAAAAKHPQAMDQVHCYCGCDKAPFHHKSLLSCFTDNHGAN